MKATYRSQQCEAAYDGHLWHVWRRNDMTRRLQLEGRPSDGQAIMLELDRSQRLTLGLPACGARTDGTALCLAHVASSVPLPSAPTCWDELLLAELWAMGWLGEVALTPTEGSEA